MDTKYLFQKIKIPLNFIIKFINFIKEKFGIRGNQSRQSPSELADVIRYFIEGKTVCDIGCHIGHFMEDMNKYANKVIGVDIMSSRVEATRKKGFEAYHLDAMQERLPDADVYFICIDNIKKPPILDNLRKQGKSGRLVIIRSTESDWNMKLKIRRVDHYLKIFKL